MQKIYIYGASGLGRELLDMLEDLNAMSPLYDIRGFLDDGVEAGTMIDNLQVAGGIDYLKKLGKERIGVVFAIAEPVIKNRLYCKIKRENPNVIFPVIVHNTASVSPRAVLEEGVVICRFCWVTADTHLGKCVFLNTRCDVGHDSKLGDFCSLMPSVNISGNVTVGEQTLIGVQSAIIQGVSIGSRVTVGMGSRVMADVPDDCTVMGYPARIIARHQTEDSQ